MTENERLSQRADSVPERIRRLREQMDACGMDAYLVPTADFHGSEYVSGYFKCREYLTGFTGSAGTAVITCREACLWTDGRYFVQAEAELAGSGIQLMRMGQEGVPTVEEYLEKELPAGGVLGFDGRVVSQAAFEELSGALSRRQIRFETERDLMGEIWDMRPALPDSPIWRLADELAGETAGQKLASLRGAMEEKHAGAHLTASLDEIAWLLNIRGGDILYTPVALSFLLVTEKKAVLFIEPSKVSEELASYLAGAGVELAGYEEAYAAVSTLRGTGILLEKGRISCRLFGCLDASNPVIEGVNPAALGKAVKNPVEIEHMKEAHRKDGVAMVRFLMRLKSRVQKAVGAEDAGMPDESLWGDGFPDEYEAAQYLDELRRQQGAFGPSFETISAYGSNAAMCHYAAPEEGSRRLEARGLYLVDSGGQYPEGTTDVTRTVALGPLTREEKEAFTLVASAMLRLLDVKFPYGCRGPELDYAAREVLWKRGMDYNHGTGHGVSFLGPVHERCCGISFRAKPDAGAPKLAAGMITSNEPGLYLEGQFGIRTENLMLCVEAEKTAFGQFLRFENLTWVPIDLDAIDADLMEAADRERLNRYHSRVYEELADRLDEKERRWLRRATRRI